MEEKNKENLGLDKNNYYAVIPYPVLRCNDLPYLARLVYGEIASLVNKEGFCWASNQHFASIFDVSIQTISKHIGLLVKFGFINIEIDKEGGNKRKVYLTEALGKKDFRGMKEIFQTPMKEKLQKEYNNIELHKDNILKVFFSYNSSINSKAKLTQNGKAKIATRLKTFTLQELIRAINNFSKDSWRMSHNAGKGVAWFFASDDKVDQWINMKPKKKAGVVNIN